MVPDKVVVPLRPSQQFGKNVHRLRQDLEWTQEMLAEKADISRRHLQLIEAGEMNPSVEIAIQLKKALGCSWEEIFEKC